MTKVILFSLFLIVGLILSQILPGVLAESYESFRFVLTYMLSISLSYIMINVGREFILNKKEWRSYTVDYFIAMGTAALPWLFVCLYFMLIIPWEYFGDWEVWKDNLLLSRFAAPTSAGILFSMLAAVGLKSSWVYKKIQVLAIFDDLDTILLMIPLQIMMIGLQWELHIVLIAVTVLLYVGWKYLNRLNLPQNWYWMLLAAIGVVGISEFIYRTSLIISENGIHIEILLPAFIFGMILKNTHVETAVDHKASTTISYIFMLLVGLSMPLFVNEGSSTDAGYSHFMPIMSWNEIIFHVFIATFLSNIGKLVPLFFYRDRKISERLALSIGMFTRGEVGAGIIVIAMGYNILGSLLTISILTIVLNLILTGFFIILVKKLALRSAIVE
ncbi:MAG: sodium:proton antiporter [Paludibacter sp.]|nr:sodium:proton antiporter [Paludibacter sp.]